MYAAQAGLTSEQQKAIEKEHDEAVDMHKKIPRVKYFYRYVR